MFHSRVQHVVPIASTRKEAVRFVRPVVGHLVDETRVTTMLSTQPRFVPRMCLLLAPTRYVSWDRRFS